MNQRLILNNVVVENISSTIEAGFIVSDIFERRTDEDVKDVKDLQSLEEVTTVNSTNVALGTTTQETFDSTETTTDVKSTTDFTAALKDFVKYFTVSTDKIISTSQNEDNLTSSVNIRSKVTTTISPPTTDISISSTTPTTSTIPETTSSTSTTIEPTETTVNSLQQFIENIESATKSVVVSNLSNDHTSDNTQRDKLIQRIENDTKSTIVSRTMTDNTQTTQEMTTTETITTNIATETPETTTPQITTTEFYTTTERVSSRRKVVGRRRQNSTNNRKKSEHRFRVRPKEEEQEIVDTASSFVKTSSFNQLSDTSTKPGIQKSTTRVPATDADLSRSANPTPEEIPPTPSIPNKFYRMQVRKNRIGKDYVFNCFGRELNRFYSDPRDCRLFHYCTSGFTKNQLLDMKFVCDSGTYFDDERLVCTTLVPSRCA